MLPDDRHFLALERHDHLLREAAAKRLARLAPRGTRRSLREQVAKLLIVLAAHIAPAVRYPSHGSYTVHV